MLHSFLLLQEKPSEEHQLARIADIDFINLANEILLKWEIIGRLLGVKDSSIDQISADKAGSIYEQSYAMLKAWKNSQPDSNAPCEQLKQALCHKLVMKNSLVQQYCYQPKN